MENKENILIKELGASFYLNKAQETQKFRDFSTAEYFINLAFLQKATFNDKINGLCIKSFIYHTNGELSKIYSVIRDIRKYLKKIEKIDKELINSVIRSYFRFCKVLEKDDNRIYLISIVFKDIYFLIKKYNLSEKMEFTDLDNLEENVLKRIQENVSNNKFFYKFYVLS